jgi:hypothetical protein
MPVLRFMNPQISQILVLRSAVQPRSHAKQQINGGTQSFFVGCVLRTATVKFEINDIAESVSDGALRAPYTFNFRGHLC